MAQHADYARIVVVTERVWRAEQLAQMILAIDGLCSRLAWAASLAEMLKQSDWVLTNARMYGLMDKGPPKNWGQSEHGVEDLSRGDYLKWTLMLRAHGIRVREEQLSWSLAFDTDDLLNVIPSTNRCELESVSMCSPGWLTFLMTGAHAKPGFFSLVKHFFDSIRWPTETRRIMRAAAMVAEAKAATELTKAVQTLKKAIDGKETAQGTNVPSVAQPRPESAMQVSFDKQRDTLAVALRDASLPLTEVQRAILNPVQENANMIYQCTAQGLIQFITAESHPAEEKNG